MILLIINNIYFKSKYCCKHIQEICNKIDHYNKTENIYIVTLDDSCKLIEDFIRYYNKKIKFVLIINYLNLIKKKNNNK